METCKTLSCLLFLAVINFSIGAGQLALMRKSKLGFAAGPYLARFAGYSNRGTVTRSGLPLTTGSRAAGYAASDNENRFSTVLKKHKNRASFPLFDDTQDRYGTVLPENSIDRVDQPAQRNQNSVHEDRAAYASDRVDQPAQRGLNAAYENRAAYALVRTPENKNRAYNP